MEEEMSVKENAENRCPACGIKILNSASVCPGCGLSLTGQASDEANRRPEKVGGWLLLLVINMVFLTPIVNIISQYSTYMNYVKNYWFDSRIQFASGPGIAYSRRLSADLFQGSPYSNIFIVDSIFLGILILLFIISGIKIYKLKKDSIYFTKLLLILYWIYTVISAAFYSILLYINDSAYNGNPGVDLSPRVFIWGKGILLSLIPVVVWYAYLSKSERVRKTFALPEKEESRSMALQIKNINSFGELFNQKKWGYNYYLLFGLLVIALFQIFYFVFPSLFSVKKISYSPSFYVLYSMDLYFIFKLFLVLMVVFLIPSKIKSELLLIFTFSVVSVLLMYSFNFIITWFGLPGLIFETPFYLIGMVYYFIYSFLLIAYLIGFIKSFGFTIYSVLLSFFLSELIASIFDNIYSMIKYEYWISTESVIEQLTQIIAVSIVSGFIFYFSISLFLKSRYKTESPEEEKFIENSEGLTNVQNQLS
jgi:hypothetical protein